MDPAAHAALRAAVVEAGRTGWLDAESARRALGALDRSPGAGAVALRQAGMHEELLRRLLARVPGSTAPDRGAATQLDASARPGDPTQLGAVRTGEGSTPKEGSSSGSLSSSMRLLGKIAPGSRIGPYVVDGELGRGGMGVVLRAHDDAGQAAALKLVIGLRPTTVKRFSREIQALSALDHPNVVRYLGSGEEPVPWLAMELVEGSDLKAYLRDRRLAPEEAACLVGGIAAGVAHAHGRGIIHRDLKPSNVLVRTGGRPIVTDFGLAKDLDASRFTQTGAMLGTLGTMAPEQVRGETVGPPADVWALGMILYQCLTGREAFGDEAALAISAAIVRDTIPPPRSIVPSIPVDLDRTCMACLERDVARRPTATGLARALRDRRAPGGVRRRRGPVIALVATATAVVLGAVVVTWMLRAPATTTGAPPAVTQPPPPATDRPAIATAAAPWGAPAAPWKAAWALAGGPQADVPAAALWDEPARVAAPLAAVLANRPGAREAALLGSARAGPRERLVVRYDLGRALRPVAAVEPAWFIQTSTLPAGQVVPLSDGGVSVLAANDAGYLDLVVGSARWRTPGMVVRWRRLTQIDGEDLGLRLGLPWSDEDAAPWLRLSGRNATADAAGARVTYRWDDAWRTLAFAPGTGTGERVALDGPAQTLDAVLDSPAPPGQVAIRLGETHLALAEVEVSGTLVRPDVAALAWAPGALPPRARVAAAFEREDGGSGGPVLALGDPDRVALLLEVDGRTLRLSRGARTLAEAPAPDGDAGWLLLERGAGDVVKGVVVVGGSQARVEHADPLPLAASGLRAGWGSTAPRVRFTRVEVHAGEDDEGRRTLDDALTRGLEAATEHARRAGDDGPGAAWRAGGLLLARVTDDAWVDGELMGRGANAARHAVAAEAGRWLERALDGGLAGPAREDALVRSILAWVVAADRAGARRAAERALDALGPAGASARLDALERDATTFRPALRARLAAGYATTNDVPVRDAALAAAELLVPERLGKILAGRANNLRHGAGGPAATEEAIALFLRAREAGADPAVVDMPLADCYLALERFPEAIAEWDRALTHAPISAWYAWSRRAFCLAKVGRVDEGLESSLGALACIPTRAPMQEQVLDFARQLNPSPGLAACALAAVADARGEPEASPLRAAALEKARLAATADDRDGDLARYVLARARQQVTATDGGGRPTAALARAYVAGPAAIPEVVRAAERDALVGHLARLDPALAPLLGR